MAAGSQCYLKLECGNSRLQLKTLPSKRLQWDELLSIPLNMANPKVCQGRPTACNCDLEGAVAVLARGCGLQEHLQELWLWFGEGSS